jgi:hypothetical protein
MTPAWLSIWLGAVIALADKLRLLWDKQRF